MLRTARSLVKSAVDVLAQTHNIDRRAAHGWIERQRITYLRSDSRRGGIVQETSSLAEHYWRGPASGVRGSSNQDHARRGPTIGFLVTGLWNLT